MLKRLSGIIKMGLDVALTSQDYNINTRCPHCRSVYVEITHDTYYADNITHNLAPMAREAGLYDVIWEPKVNRAYDLAPLLQAGLSNLLSAPNHYKNLNPKNGYGCYDDLVRFTERYLAACQENPYAWVRIYK